MKTKITPEVSEFIFKNHLKMSKKQIAQHFCFSVEVCKGFYRRNNIVIPDELTKKFQMQHLYKPFTKADNDYIIQNIENKSVKQIALELKRSSCTVQKQTHILGLHEIMERKKVSSYFNKGHTPKNKGIKQVDYMTPEAIEKTKATRFQKGQEPKNTTFDGNITIRADHKNRKGKLYKWIRISKGKWELLHRHIWATEKGEIPKGYNVVFKDGDTLNCVIENLECISNEENMKRNSIQRYPFELKTKIRKVAKLKKVIKEIEQSNFKNHEQN